jgi:hypothetical protein
MRNAPATQIGTFPNATHFIDFCRWVLAGGEGFCFVQSGEEKGLCGGGAPRRGSPRFVRFPIGGFQSSAPATLRVLRKAKALAEGKDRSSSGFGATRAAQVATGGWEGIRSEKEIDEEQQPVGEPQVIAHVRVFASRM